MFNIGNAGGSAIARIALGTSLHEAGPATFGTLISGLTLVPLGALALLGATKTRPVFEAADVVELPTRECPGPARREELGAAA
jgi:hypothetical protein